MAKYTVDGYNNKLKKQLTKLNSGALVEIAARTSMVEQVKRIFDKGGNSAGGQIGSYNTKDELWIDDSKLPSTPTHVGKTGKTIKTSYYPSYKAMRAQQGRKTNVVNLTLFGRLRSEYSNSPVGAANPTKISKLVYVSKLQTKENKSKKAGMEDKYGEIFDLTTKEVEVFRKELDLQFKQLMDA